MKKNIEFMVIVLVFVGLCIACSKDNETPFNPPDTTDYKFVVDGAVVTELTFPDCYKDAVIIKSIVVSNMGPKTMTINGVSIINDIDNGFSIYSNTYTAPLAAGETASYYLYFEPLDGKRYSAGFQVDTSLVDNYNNLSLVGDGITGSPLGTPRPVSVGPVSIEFTWDTLAEATFYQIVYRDGGGTPGVYPYTPAGVTAPTTTLVISGLNPATEYVFALIGSNSFGPLPASDPTNVTTLPGLNSPAVTASNLVIGSIFLSWSSAPGAASYFVFRTNLSAGGSLSEIASAITVTAYTDTTVTNYASYEYYLRASNNFQFAAPGSADSLDAAGLPFVPVYTLFSSNKSLDNPNFPSVEFEISDWGAGSTCIILQTATNRPALDGWFDYNDVVNGADSFPNIYFATGNWSNEVKVRIYASNQWGSSVPGTVITTYPVE